MCIFCDSAFDQVRFKCVAILIFEALCWSKDYFCIPIVMVGSGFTHRFPLRDYEKINDI
jgi:hypothetical protein